jgi:hypothetical protein
MVKQERNQLGQYAPKEKKLRRLYLSDDDWELWGEISANKGFSREEFIENYLKSKTRG